MANNPQFSGLQPFRPSTVGSMDPPQNFVPPMSAQFRPAVPVPQSQPFIPMSSQHFQPVGSGAPLMNPGFPSHAQQTQFSQLMPQLPPRPSQQVPLPSQAMPLPVVRPNMHVSSESLMPRPDSQIANGYTPGLSGPGVHLSSSFTFSSSSYGQLQMNNTAAAPFQPVSQVHASGISSGEQLRLQSESQSSASNTPLQNKGAPTPVTAAPPPATNIHPNPSGETSTDWIEHTSANGRRFYYNKKTKVSSWEKPIELMTPIERADASTNWKEYTSPDGRKYYYNKVTKESKWSIPNELKLAREQVEKASNQGTPLEASTNSYPRPSVSSSVVEAPSGADDSSSAGQGPSSSPVLVAPVATIDNPQSEMISRASASPVVAPKMETSADEVGAPANTDMPMDCSAGSGEAAASNVDAFTVSMNSDNNSISPQGGPSSADGAPTQDVEDTGKEISGEKNNNIASELKAVDREPSHANKMEAKNAFKTLLESADVGSDWTWDRAMRVIINDKRYGALKSLGERKQAFNEFLNQKKKQEAEEKRMKQKKARENFKKMLEECTELTSSTRWSKIVPMFENDERFKAVERDRDRRDLFDNFLEELANKERARAQEERKHNILEYRKLLESCDFIKANSQWRKVQDRLEADERCSRLEKIDRLEIFQDYLRDLEKEEEEQRRIQKEELRKVERKNRDEFRKLMEEHVAEGTLTAKTHWRDYVLKVKDLPAYMAVASNTSGSTPKELFEDVAEELDKQYHEDKTRIKDAVKLGKIPLSSTWTFEDLKTAIIKDVTSPPISDVNLKLVLDELLERVREKEEKEAKKRKRFADDFFHLLCSIKEITELSTWEDCRTFFEDSPEFRSMGDEIQCREIFEEYVTELKEQAKESEQKRKEEKAKKEKEREERERRKGKHRREKEGGRDKEKEDSFQKDAGEGENANTFDIQACRENRRSGEDDNKKQRKQQKHSEDIIDEIERDRNKKDHGHSSDRKKSRRHTSGHDSDGEGSRHKRHRRDHRSGSRRDDHGELEDGEFGASGDRW